MEFSPKQASFIAHSDAFLNLADGSVRSGKTHAALIRLAELSIQGPPGDFAVFGKTERTVRRNVVYPLQDLFPGAIKHVQGAGELHIFGRRCHVIGANDARSEEKVRGMTLAGGYFNELSLYPEGVFEQAIARSLSIRGAKWIGDTNPDSPYHWLAQKFLTADHPKAYLKRWRFKLTDNPILPAQNVEMLKALYGPGTLFYRRNIDGEWVVAEGAIFDQFDERYHVVDNVPAALERFVVGVDYGTANATVFLLLGKSGNAWYVLKEYRHDSREAGRQKTDAEYARDFIEWLGAIRPSSIEVDPSAASFKLQLKTMGVRKIYDANNEVLDGIRRVSQALSGGHLFIHRSCKGLIPELANYAWNPKAQEKGVDEPVKANDHGPDALRYAVSRILGPQPTRALRVIR